MRRIAVDRSLNTVVLAPCAACARSCSPNCHVAPNGDGDERSHLRIVTTGTVAKDEELTISYVDLLADDMKDGASRRCVSPPPRPTPDRSVWLKVADI